MGKYLDKYNALPEFVSHSRKIEYRQIVLPCPCRKGHLVAERTTTVSIEAIFAATTVKPDSIKHICYSCGKVALLAQPHPRVEIKYLDGSLREGWVIMPEDFHDNPK